MSGGRSGATESALPTAVAVALVLLPCALLAVLAKLLLARRRRSARARTGVELQRAPATQVASPPLQLPSCAPAEAPSVPLASADAAALAGGGYASWGLTVQSGLQAGGTTTRADNGANEGGTIV